MATAWWWFVAMNALVVAITVLSTSCARRSPLLPTPRRHRSGVTRRASSASAVLQSLLSLSLFSFPSTCLSSYLQPQPDVAAAAATDQETETEELVARSSPAIEPSASATPRALQLTPPAPAPAADEAGDEDEEEDPNAMSMDEAYALVLASQQRPEREREEEARRSEVDAKAEEFIRSFKEELRQQRLDSISNYTHMLKRQPPASGGQMFPRSLLSSSASDESSCV